MVDKELLDKVIVAITCCQSLEAGCCEKCPYKNDATCCHTRNSDTLTVLEQVRKERNDIDSVAEEAVRHTQRAIKFYYGHPRYQPTKEQPIKHTSIEHLYSVVDTIADEAVRWIKEGKE